jgi:hypothetical protein
VSDGYNNVSAIYHFTTSNAYVTTIRTDGVDYFVWLGDDDATASTLDTLIDLNITWSAGEYVAVWTATSWGDDGLWQYYYPHDDSGTNFNIDTFMVIKVYITDDSGDIQLSMTADTGTTYTSARELTLTNAANLGGNYVGWTDDLATTASEIANTKISTTLDADEQIWYWNEVTYDWDYYIVGFLEPAISITVDDVLFISVADSETLNIGGKAS